MDDVEWPDELITRVRNVCPDFDFGRVTTPEALRADLLNPDPEFDALKWSDELDGFSPILMAVRRNDLEQVKALLAADPTLVEAGGHIGQRPLHLAAELDLLDMARLLLAAGADVNGRRERKGDARKDTPLFFATSAAMAELLIAAGADVHAKDYAGREATHLAAQFTRCEVLRCLLDHGCAVDARDEWDVTPLHWAVGGLGSGFCGVEGPDNLACVELLLAHGADPNAARDDGEVALWAVAVMPDMSPSVSDPDGKRRENLRDVVLTIVQRLLAAGADPHHQDSYGRSPRMRAVPEVAAVMDAYGK